MFEIHNAAKQAERTNMFKVWIWWGYKILLMSTVNHTGEVLLNKAIGLQTITAAVRATGSHISCHMVAAKSFNFKSFNL